MLVCSLPECGYFSAPCDTNCSPYPPRHLRLCRAGLQSGLAHLRQPCRDPADSRRPRLDHAVLRPRCDQLPAGACSHLTARRQGATPPLLIGVCNHTISPCRATALSLGPLSESLGSPAGGTSPGVSQYGLSPANGRSPAAFDECRSVIAPVTDMFNSAPNCSWDALIVFSIFRANQMPAARKTNWLRRFPVSYQLLCIQTVTSFMASPWDWDTFKIRLPSATRYWREVQKTGRWLPALAAYPPARAPSCAV